MNLVGLGYDIHAFASPEAQRKLVLGGVEIAHPVGLDGHSDADVLCHAIADAVLGAIGEADIGHHFPNTDETLRGITLVEGWTWRQFREAMNKSAFLKHDSAALDDEELMSHLGKAGMAPEGRFYPDTYMVGKGSSDLHVLQRAAQAMDRQLSLAWAQRDMGLPLKNADEALVLASIVEKETGRISDRPMIASVFINRLRIDMPLQTDPTVIYGMFERFDGNLRRVDLQTDHPWNTYTRKGLPPTPIAMPGKGALTAALHPATSQALYFVARGDGSSQFSTNLADHNAAVNKYQRSPSAKAQ